MESRRLELAADAVHEGAAREQVAHDLEAAVDRGPVQERHVLAVHLVHVDAHDLDELANPERNR